MRRLILILISSCTVLLAIAQEDFSLDSLTKLPPEMKLGRKPIMEQTLNFDETTFADEFKLTDNFNFHQPLLPDYNKNLDFTKYIYPSKATSFSYYTLGSSFHSVFPFGHIFNQSSYKLNNRLIIGGNSFGARSVFDLPKLNSTIQDMSIKGASMFMQYKVNDHFKVQTRISISNQGSAPWIP